MANVISCPKCRVRLRLPTSALGSEVRCPSCGASFEATAPRTDITDRIEVVSPRLAPPERGTPERDVSDKPPKREPGLVVWGRRFVALVVMAFVVSVGTALVILVVKFNQSKSERDEASAPLVDRPSEEWPKGEQPTQEVPWGEKPIGEKPPAEKPIGEKPIGERPRVDRPWDERDVPVELKFEPLTEKEIEEEVRPLFEKLNAAFGRADGDRAADLFDFTRVLVELHAQGPFPELNRDQFTRARLSIKAGFGRALSRMARILHWEKFEIRQVKSLSLTDAVVIARHISQGGAIVLKFRWWVSRRSGEWRFYDYEDLDSGIRMSVEAHGIVRAIQPGNLARVRSIQEASRLVAQIIAMAGERPNAEIEQKLQQLRRLDLLPSHRFVERILTAGFLLDQAKPQEVLEVLEEARKIAPDAPLLRLIRGTALNQLGEWQGAIEEVKAYRDLLGEDATVCFQLGEALRGLRKFDKAVVEYRKSLDFDPNQWEAMRGLLYSLEPGKDQDDIDKRFAKLNPPKLAYDYLLGEHLETRYYAGLVPLSLAMRKKDPSYSPAAFYLAFSYVQLRDPKKAKPAFDEWSKLEKDEGRREELTREFLGAMFDTGRALEGYEWVRDKPKAFDFLGREMVSHRRSWALPRLVEKHEANFPDDSNLPLFRATILADQGKYAEARKIFESEAKNADAADKLTAFRHVRVRVWYHTGDGLHAWKEFGAPEESLEELANLALLGTDWQFLDGLLDAESKRSPDNARVAWYRFLGSVRREKIDEAVGWYRKAVGSLEEKELERSRYSFAREMVQAKAGSRAYETLSDWESAFSVVASQLRFGQDSTPLEKVVRAHRKRKPDDPLGQGYSGLLLVKQKEWDRAAKEFTSCWPNLEPKTRNLFERDFVHALYRSGRKLEPLSVIGPRSVFVLASLCHEEEDYETLEQVIARHRKQSPDDPYSYFLEAELRVAEGKIVESSRCLAKAVELDPKEARRNGYVDSWTRDVVEKGKGLEAYRLSPDPVSSVDGVAYRLLQEKRTADLRKLLEGHAKNHDEPNLVVLWAELHLLEGNPLEAEELLEEAVVDQGLEWEVRSVLDRVLVRLGKVVETYRGSLAKKNRGTDLGYACVFEKDARQLEALLAEWVREGRSEGSMIRWRLEMLWLDKEYAKVVAFVRSKTKKEWAKAGLAVQNDSYLLRSLLRLGRNDEARTEAKRMIESNPSRAMHLAFGVLGREDDLLGRLDRSSRRWGVPRSLYDDEDLGPILMGKGFEKFRRKYPPPSRE